MRLDNTSITIRDIEIHARHGVLEHEKTYGNLFRVTVTLNFDAEGAMKYDDLSLTVNYAEVVQIVKDVMETPSDLIEHVAYRIINALREAFPIVKSGTVSITKVHPPFDAITSGATFTASFS